MVTDPWALPNLPLTPAAEPDGSDIAGLLKLIQIQQDVLIAVSRHELSFQDVDADDAYKERARRIRRALKLQGLDDPLPYRNLRDYWNQCSREHGTYADRRDALERAVYPITDALEAREEVGIVDWATDVPATWAVLEARITELKAEYASATTLDTYQDVGRRSVEIIIGAVNLVWNENMVEAGQEAPAGADAKAKFDQILATLPGGSHEELRAVLRGAWRLGHATKHSGSTSRLSAYTSAQAAILIARSLREVQQQLGAG